MQDLYTWLEEQNGGIRTYVEFQQKLNKSARENPDNAAIFTLLGRLADRFVTRFEGEPLSVDDAGAAIEELKTILSQAIGAIDGSPGEKMNFANRIATVDLLEAKAAG